LIRQEITHYMDCGLALLRLPFSGEAGWRSIQGAIAAILLTSHVHAIGAEIAPEAESFINTMVAKHGFKRGQLQKWFGQAKTQTAVLQAMARAGTARPWYEFRQDHVNDARIRTGLEFWERNAQTLARASADFGVPEQIIVATLGTETFYGRRNGRYSTFDVLSTLAFNYPPRADFFRGELEEYLLLARENGVNPLQYKGSYAGALGIAQFMPSNYRRYAVDYDGDGKRDLWNDADAIASVANYYRSWGWQAGQRVIAAVEPPSAANRNAYVSLLQGGIKPHTPVSKLKEAGVTLLDEAPDDLMATLLAAHGDSGMQYWLGFDNFYVITRYNRSTNYALAVHELALELVRARQRAEQPVRAAP
jgi:membrane-bound lytic murein transglycosylase B